jgi:hypothetical protein
MDILCINQRDEDARVAVTQHIPTIFLCAERTIVIRGGAGLRDCCVEAYKLLPGGEAYDYETARAHHRTVHKDIHFEESVLSRLWPLQEIILSDCILFVRCEDVADEEIMGSHSTQSMSSANILSDLLDLSMAWSLHANNPTGSSELFVKFQHAFLNCSSVARCPRNKQRSVPANLEFYIHISSTRRTSEPRDFILAIMPQYKCYTVPKAAKQMSFGQLFVDCCNQLELAPSFADLSMTPLLVRGSFGNCDAPIATDDIPPPTCLGDFIRLLGGGKPILPRDNPDVIPPQTMSGRQIELQNVICTDVFETIRLIKQCMNASKDLWGIAMLEIREELWLAGLGMDSSRLMLDQSGSNASVILTRLRIIFEILMSPNPADQIVATLMRRDEFKEFLPAPDSLHSLVRFTALISCGLTSSFFEWSEQNLRPMTVAFPGQTLLILAPNSVVQSSGRYEFFLLKSTKGLMLTSQEERWVLVARDNKVEPNFDVMCLFPPDVEIS